MLRLIGLVGTFQSFQLMGVVWVVKWNILALVGNLWLKRGHWMTHGISLISDLRPPNFGDDSKSGSADHAKKIG